MPTTQPPPGAHSLDQDEERHKQHAGRQLKGGLKGLGQQKPAHCIQWAWLPQLELLLLGCIQWAWLPQPELLLLGCFRHDSTRVCHDKWDEREGPSVCAATGTPCCIQTKPNSLFEVISM